MRCVQTQCPVAAEEFALTWPSALLCHSCPARWWMTLFWRSSFSTTIPWLKITGENCSLRRSSEPSVRLRASKWRLNRTAEAEPRVSVSGHVQHPSTRLITADRWMAGQQQMQPLDLRVLVMLKPRRNQMKVTVVDNLGEEKAEQITFWMCGLISRQKMSKLKAKMRNGMDLKANHKILLFPASDNYPPSFFQDARFLQASGGQEKAEEVCVAFRERPSPPLRMVTESLRLFSCLLLRSATSGPDWTREASITFFYTSKASIAIRGEAKDNPISQIGIYPAAFLGCCYFNTKVPKWMLKKSWKIQWLPSSWNVRKLEWDQFEIILWSLPLTLVSAVLLDVWVISKPKTTPEVRINKNLLQARIDITSGDFRLSLSQRHKLKC